MLIGLVRRSGLAVAVATLVAAGCSSGGEKSSLAPGSAPLTPTGVAATAVFAQVTVGWTDNGSSDTHNVYWSTTSGAGTTGTEVKGVANPFIQTGRTNGTALYYVVTAVNVNGESPASAEATATPLATMKPATPTKASVVPGPESDTLSWAAVNGATSYNIYWSNIDSVDVTKPATFTKINNSTSKYTHALLTDSIAYYYLITAQNANGESAPTGDLTATPLPPLAALSAVSAKNGVNTKDTIFWKDTVATSWNVYRGGAGVNSVTFDTVFTGKTSPFVDSLLTAGTTYHYVVTRVKNGVESAVSNEVTATPGPQPAAPVNLTGVATDTTATIGWDAVTGATSYIVYYSASAGVTPKSGKAVPVAAPPVAIHIPTHHDSVVVNGHDYHFIVTTITAGVQSKSSLETVVQPNEPPALAASLTATGGNVSDTLKWKSAVVDTTTNSPATSYNVYWSTTSPVTTGSGTPVLGVQSPYVHTGLTNGTTYYYIVTAVNSASESAPVPQVSATPGLPPAKATALTAVLGASGAGTLAWTAGAAATSHNLYYGSDPALTPANADGHIIGVTNPSTQAFVGLRYYAVAEAANGVEAPISNVVALWPQIQPAGTSATPGAAASGKITISWTAQGGATGYNIYYGLATGVTTGSTKLAGVANPYLQSGLTSGTTYFYIVTATNANGESVPSAEFSAVAP